MRLPTPNFGRGDAAGLAMTLIRTFGSDALALVEEQVSTTADSRDLRARWEEVRETIIVLTSANTHMEMALGLLDKLDETSVPPILDGAIVQLGLRDGERKMDSSSVTVIERAINYYENKAQQHLADAQFCDVTEDKISHLDTASKYATLGEQISRSTR